MAAWAGVPADRVVAVLAELASGRVQWGSGFLVSGGLVLTAWHCTVDKDSGASPVSLSVVRKADGAEAAVSAVRSSPTLDVAVLELGARPWAQDWDPPRYGRVDRSRAGVLEDCQAIGYPLFQLDPGERQRNTAELHGHIRRTDEAESGYLLMRDADLTTVGVPDFFVGQGESGGTGGSPLGGLSGALVFHQGYALGIVVEHHPRQGPTAVRILPVDRIAAATAPGAPSVAAALGLPEVTALRQLTGEPLDPMAEFLAAGPPADAVQVLAGEPGSPGWSVTARFLDTALRGPGGDLPFAGRDAELATLDGWLADPDGPPYHLITGTAGAGKTTLLARWSASQAARGRDWRVIFAPVTARYEANSGLEVYRALVHRLAAVHGVPYSRTAGFTDCRDQVTALLTQGAPDRSGILVVIDGLDEASDWTPGARDFPVRPGARVRVLLSARQTGQRPTAQSWLAALELDTGTCGTTELAALRPDALVTLVEQVRGAGAPGTAELATRLLQLTGGEPVVTALYLRDLAEYLAGHPEADPAAWPGASDSVGHGISGYLDRWLQEQQRIWDTRDARRVKRALRVLSLLSLAEGPVEHAHLRLLAGRAGHSMDGGELRHALELLDRFVLPGGRRATVVLAHPLIAQARLDWLRDAGEYDMYANAYAGWASGVLAGLEDGSVAPGDVPGYLIRHAAAHLLPTGPDGTITLAVEMAEACRLLSPKWRLAQEQASDDLLGYRQGVSRVSGYARSANASAVAAGQPPPYLPEHIGCAAALAVERLALSKDMSPELASQLVRYGLWRPSRGLSYVAGLDWPISASVTELAPHLDAGDLPALHQVLAGFNKASWWQTALATAAFARRMLELSGPEAAVEAASWVPAGNESPGSVTVWALGELIPLLPAPLARRALSDSLRMIAEQRYSGNPVSLAAVGNLTRHVPAALAAELWEPAENGHEPGTRPAQALIKLIGASGDDPRSPFLHADIPPTDHWWSREFIAAASWLDFETLNYTLGAMMYTLDPRSPRSYRVMDTVLPSIPYQGMMSVVPASLAEEMATDLSGWLEPKDLTACLLQLLPVLPPEARARFAEDAFRHPETLDLDSGIAVAIGPGIGQCGYAGQVLDAAESGLISDPHWWLKTLAPYLTREQAQRALALDRGVGLARLASFGAGEAARVLGTLYQDAERLPADLVSVLTARFTDYRHEPWPEPDRRMWMATTHYGTPWWATGTYPGVPWSRDRALGVYRYPPRGDEATDRRGGGVGGAGLGVEHTAMDDRDAVSLALEAAGTLTAEDVPVLADLAGSRADPWAALTVLGATTHVPDPGLRARVTAMIASMLESLRDDVLSRAAEIRRVRDGLPGDCPWLMLASGTWTPFFARVLHPAAWPEVKPLLFGDGYLNGVERTHSWYREPQEHQRLDDWASEVLAFTPLLEVTELDQISRLVEPPGPRVTSLLSAQVAQAPQSKVRSETTRGWFWAGLAVGYAARGAWDAAATSLRKIGGADENTATEAALAEMGARCAPGELPAWLAHVRQFLPWGERPSLLVRVLNNRWPELSDDQCWAALDQWLGSGSYGRKTDVAADALAYADAINRLADPGELRRILKLLTPE